jgi:hypothetical protein
MTETFADWSALPNDCRDRFVVLEDFIGDLDGREIEDGTVDADDAVKALNWLAVELARLRARPTEEEVAQVLFHLDFEKLSAREVARAVIAMFPKVQP